MMSLIFDSTLQSCYQKPGSLMLVLGLRFVFVNSLAMGNPKEAMYEIV